MVNCKRSLFADWPTDRGYQEYLSNRPAVLLPKGRGPERTEKVDVEGSVSTDVIWIMLSFETTQCLMKSKNKGGFLIWDNSERMGRVYSNQLMARTLTQAKEMLLLK